MKTSELTGPALDWAVAKCQGVKLHPVPQNGVMEIHFSEPDGCTTYQPSTDWAQGGPIIEREEIELHVIPNMRDPANWGNCTDEDKWCANIWPSDADLIKMAGPTPLIAAMRVYVASKLGDDVEIPKELTA